MGFYYFNVSWQHDIGLPYDDALDPQNSVHDYLVPSIYVVIVQYYYSNRLRSELSAHYVEWQWVVVSIEAPAHCCSESRVATHPQGTEFHIVPCNTTTSTSTQVNASSCSDARGTSMRRNAERVGCRAELVVVVDTLHVIAHSAGPCAMHSALCTRRSHSSPTASSWFFMCV